MTAKPVLAGLSLEELKQALGQYPSFRARQIHEWICRGVETFDEMTNLPLSLREELSGNYSLLALELSGESPGDDGTLKLGMKNEDGAVIEAVILRDGKNRKTACLSSQAGCPAGCVFCKTGRLGFKRNLNFKEIVSQFLLLKKKESEISRIVIMGMGEPLFNLSDLRKAIDFFTASSALNISKRRITLSTSGIVEGILDLANNGPDIRLAVSLVTAKEDLRNRLMPISRENPLARLKEALIEYQRKRERRVTLEMVLLAGINTDSSEAEAAAGFAKGLNAVFNLIPWNPVSGLEFEGRPLQCPCKKEIASFAAALESRGLKVTRRIEKGRGISGACGQLGVVDFPPENGIIKTDNLFATGY